MPSLLDLTPDLTTSSAPQFAELSRQARDAAQPIQHIVLDDFLQLGVADATNALREARARVPDKGAGLSAIDAALAPLMKIEMLDIIGPFDGPETGDILISDVRPDDLPKDISLALSVDYLAASSVTERWPLHGVLYGHNSRCMVAVPVSAKGRCVLVHCIFDNCSPKTYLSGTALDALGIQAWELSEEPVRVNGVRLKGLTPSRNERIGGLNILGQDFMEKAEATVTIKHSTSRWTVEKDR